MPPLQKNNGEILAACYQLYLIDRTGDKIDVLGRRIKNYGITTRDGKMVGRRNGNFGEGGYNRGLHCKHDQVKRARHADGSLVVAADIDFLAPNDSSSLSEATLQGYKDRERWATKISELYNDPASSDCTIQVGSLRPHQPLSLVHSMLTTLFQIGNTTLHAHKLFLMACSPAFRVMFSNPSAESKSGVVEINDFRPEPVRALLHYCYQGRLDDATKDGDDVVEIFQLADKYCIDDLKALLERHFIDKRLTVENVIDLAVLADTHSAGNLKKVSAPIGVERAYD